jgi:eukaryotic-like serine/threonine-protein kinase
MESPSSERDIFSQVSELSAQTDREAWLVEHYPDQAALHRRILDLMASAEGAEQWLPDLPLPHVPGEQPGDVIGKWRLIAQVGVGGFGTVWEAEQFETVKRRVALKVLNVGQDSGAVLLRFEIERQALALLDHPHVARIYDAGSTPAGRPYFVMELLCGKSLISFVREKKLPLRLRLVLIQQVASALHHAHQRGVIHRDIKPSNILVIESDGLPSAKVIDFGIARLIAEARTDITLAGQHWGTPIWMSPEQRAGRSVDVRTDVYSLGLVMHELIGDQQSPRNTEADAALPLPSVLPGEIDWIIARATAPDLAQRYESAAAFRDDLQAYLTGGRVMAGPPTFRYLAVIAIRRHRAGLIAAAAVIMMMIGATVVSVSYASQARKSEREMRQALEQALTGETRAQEAFEVMKEALLTGDGGADGQWDRTVNEVVLDLTANLPPRVMADPVLEWELRYTLACCLQGQGKFELAHTVALRLISLGQELADKNRLGFSYLMAGTTLIEMDRHVEAEPLCRQAIPCLDPLGPGHCDWHISRLALAKCLIVRGDIAAAEALIQAVIDGGQRSSLPADEIESLTARAWGVRGWACRARGDMAGWVAAAETRHRIISAHAPADDAQVLDACHHLARALSAQGEHVRALALAEESLQHRIRRFGKDHPGVNDTQTLIQSIKKKAGQ